MPSTSTMSWKNDWERCPEIMTFTDLHWVSEVSALERQNKRDPALSAHSKKQVVFPQEYQPTAPLLMQKKDVQEVFISPNKKVGKTNGLP